MMIKLVNIVFFIVITIKKINENSFIMDLDINNGLKYHSQTYLNLIHNIHKKRLSDLNIKDEIYHDTYLEILKYYNNILNECNVSFSKEADEMLIKYINKMQ